MEIAETIMLKVKVAIVNDSQVKSTFHLRIQSK